MISVFRKKKTETTSGDKDKSPKYLPLPLKKKRGTTYKKEDAFTCRQLSSGKIYVTWEYAGYDSADEDGFGMENEYDFHFFDEEKRYLGTLCAWSRRDYYNNEDRIDQEMNLLVQKK